MDGATDGAPPTLTVQRLTRVLPGIGAIGIRGFRGATVQRRDVGEEVEFLTLLLFDSTDDVRALAGPDPEVAYVPEAARAVLARWDEQVVHYDVVEGAHAPTCRVSRGQTPRVIASGVAEHTIYHAGQIALLRRAAGLAPPESRVAPPLPPRPLPGRGAPGMVPRPLRSIQDRPCAR